VTLDAAAAAQELPDEAVTMSRAATTAAEELLDEGLRKSAAVGEEFYTPAEAAARFRVHAATVQRKIRAGLFPGVIRVSARRVLIPRRLVDDMVAAAVETGACVNLEDWAGRASTVRPTGEQERSVDELAPSRPPLVEARQLALPDADAVREQAC